MRIGAVPPGGWPGVTGRLPLVLAVLLAAGAAGCAPAAPRPAGGRAASPVPGMVVVVSEHVAIDRAEGREWIRAVDPLPLERRLQACLERELGRAALPLRLIDADDYRRRVLPGLDARDAPRTLPSFRVLATDPGFRARAGAIGLRYVVLVSAREEQAEEGGIGCFGGYGGGFCLGLVTWDKTMRLRAQLVELGAGASGAPVTAGAGGRSWFAVALLIPLGMPAAPVGRACDDLARGVVAAIAAGRAADAVRPPPE